MINWSDDPDDPWVFCDGRTMRRSEMRRLVAEDMERFRQMDVERNKRMAQENAALRKELQALQRKRTKELWWAQWRTKFQRWEQLNQEARAEANIEYRAELRRKKDEAMVEALLVRIEEKQSAHRIAGFNYNELRINALDDHEYIEWMFACHEHRLVCPG